MIYRYGREKKNINYGFKSQQRHTVDKVRDRGQKTAVMTHKYVYCLNLPRGLVRHLFVNTTKNKNILL